MAARSGRSAPSARACQHVTESRGFGRTRKHGRLLQSDLTTAPDDPYLMQGRLTVGVVLDRNAESLLLDFWTAAASPSDLAVTTKVL